MAKRSVSAWIGVGFPVLACVIGSLTFPRKFLWVFESSVSFAPDLLSGVVAVFALLPLWRKGERAAPFHGPFAVVALVPLFHPCSVLANIGLGGSGPGLFRLALVWLLLLIMLLAHLDMAKYAGSSFIVILFLVSWNMTQASAAMGVFGFPFLVAALVGVVLTFDLKRILLEVVGDPAPVKWLMASQSCGPPTPR